MSVKLRAGSMELEAAFIDWLRTQGFNPADGIDPFFSASEFVRAQLPLIHESEKTQLFAEARRHLQQRCRDTAFAGQFPVVYDFIGTDKRPLRYTVALVLSDTGAEWTGRVWDESGYVGEINDRHSGAHVNYGELARMQIESRIRQGQLATAVDARSAFGGAT